MCRIPTAPNLEGSAIPIFLANFEFKACLLTENGHQKDPIFYYFRLLCGISCSTYKILPSGDSTRVYSTVFVTKL